MDNRLFEKLINYIKLARKEYPKINKAFLFGSYARGNATEDGDIDVALVFEELDDSKRFDTLVQLMMLAVKIDSSLEPHPVSNEV